MKVKMTMEEFKDLEKKSDELHDLKYKISRCIDGQHTSEDGERIETDWIIDELVKVAEGAIKQ